MNACDNSIYFSDLASVGLERLKSDLAAYFPDKELAPRSRFLLTFEFVQDTIAARKATTIRFERDVIEYPTSAYLPLVAVDQSHPGCRRLFNSGSVEVRGVCYKPFGSLSERDACRDGFDSVSALKAKLTEFYGAIKPDEIVSIFDIEFGHRDMGPAAAA